MVREGGRGGERKGRDGKGREGKAMVRARDRDLA